MLTVDQLVDRAIAFGAIQEPEELHALTTFVAGLRRHKEPFRILEIGSAAGGTFSAWCGLAVGSVISVDLPYQEEAPYDVSLGVRPDAAQARSARFLEWNPNAIEIMGDSHDPATLQRVIDALDGFPLDFLFLDGDHTYDGVRRDFWMYSPLVRSGGWIGLHDILRTRATEALGIEVWRFWETLGGLKVTINRDPNHWGIGLIRRA